MNNPARRYTFGNRGFKQLSTVVLNSNNNDFILCVSVMSVCVCVVYLFLFFLFSVSVVFVVDFTICLDRVMRNECVYEKMLGSWGCCSQFKSTTMA